MIAFDTNYLIRHIVQDNAAQCRMVAAVLSNEAKEDRSIRIHDLVLLETSWVLQTVYEFDREAWSEVMAELLADSAFSFDNINRLRAVLEGYRSGKADFADYMILKTAESEGIELKTFDKKLLKELR